MSIRRRQVYSVMENCRLIKFWRAEPRLAALVLSFHFYLECRRTRMSGRHAPVLHHAVIGFVECVLMPAKKVDGNYIYTGCKYCGKKEDAW